MVKTCLTPGCKAPVNPPSNYCVAHQPKVGLPIPRNHIASLIRDLSQQVNANPDTDPIIDDVLLRQLFGNLSKQVNEIPTPNDLMIGDVPLRHVLRDLCKQENANPDLIPTVENILLRQLFRNPHKE